MLASDEMVILLLYGDAMLMITILERYYAIRHGRFFVIVTCHGYAWFLLMLLTTLMPLRFRSLIRR